MRTPLPLLPALVCLAHAATMLSAREWSSSDGKKLDADFVSATADQVTLKRATDGQVFTIPQSRLSAEDRKWIGEQQPAKPGTGSPKAMSGPFASLITGDWALSEYEGLSYALYGGKELSAAEKYPLVLALHGKSKNEENGKQVGGWMKSFVKPENYSARPCFIVAPMGTQPWAGEGTAWSSKPGEQTIKLVKALVKTLPVDPKRVYIAGHSMGGFGTCHLMAKELRLFAAGVPVSGSGGTDNAAILARKPVWLFHAADDATVPVAGARDFAKALKNSKQFKYTELPTGGHGVAGAVFDDVATHQWLFEQRLK